MGLISIYRGCGCTGTIAFFLMLGGGQALYTASVSRNQIKMTCAEYLAKKPKGKWVKLKDCEVYHFGAITEEMFGRTQANGVFLPVRAAGTAPESAVNILLVSNKPEDREFNSELKKVKDDPTGAIKLLANNPGKYAEKRDIEGLIRTGLNAPSDADERKFYKVTDHLMSGFVIIDEGKRPSFFTATGMIAAAIVFAILRLVLEKNRPAVPPPLASNVPPPLPPQPPPLPS